MSATSMDPILYNNIADLTYRLGRLSLSKLSFFLLSRRLVGVFERRPLEGGGVDSDLGFSILRRFEMLLDQFRCYANHVLTLPIFHHVQRLKSRNNVGLTRKGRGKGRASSGAGVEVGARS